MHGEWGVRDEPEPFSFAGELAGAETVDAAVTAAVEATAVPFDQPITTVCSFDPDEEAVTCVDRSTTAAEKPVPPPSTGRIARVHKNDSALRIGETAEAEPTAGLREPLCEEIVAPVGSFGALSVGSTAAGAFDEDDVSIVEGIAAALGSALERIEGGNDPGKAAVGTGDRTGGDADDADTAALGRLNELTTDAGDVDATIEAMLSLGCDHLGLEAGILSRVDGTDYHIESVVDATGTYEEGATFPLEETMCAATLATRVTEPLSFADVRDTEHAEHPAAGGVRAYVGVPVVVDGETYGTVNFSSTTARENAFRPAERAFVTLVAGWIGNAIERRRRFAELERYETILEAVDDPVYALDTEGRFTFVNAAAKREFGYGEEILGEHVSVGMREADIERISDARRALAETDERSVRSQFTLETADGEERTVENRLAVIGDEEFRGTAGVLRDVTERESRRRRLESFQRAIDEAADGVAVLEDGEYVFVDRTHVDMYGFESREQLLGNTWRMLYDEAEIARLEAEAFPALESTGHWRGKVTGNRPDGTTFPAELSLTIVGDGRLVCTVRDETERAARERELELKEQAMDEANVGIRITDPTQKGNPMVYVNDGFEAMTGYDEAEALGENPRMLHDHDADPETLGRLREAIAGEEPTTADVRHVRADGTPYWARLSVTPVHEESGDLTNVIGVQEDITERKRRERDREATVDVFERVYQLTTDPDRSFEEKVDGLLAAGQEYLGLPNGFLTRIEPDAGEGTQTVVDARGSHEHLQPGESCPLPKSYCRKTIGHDEVTTITNAAKTGWEGDPAHDLFGLETYIGGEVTAGGELYGTLCFAATEPRDGEFTETERSFVGLLRRWAGYEIERENDQAELREQRERLELVLSGTGTGIAEWDLRTDAVTWNETLRETVGRNPGTVEAFTETVHPEDRDRVQDRLETMLETGESWTGEFRVIGGDEEILWLETRAVPVYEDGDPVRVLATGTDVTDAKRTERERRRNERRFRSLFEDPETLVGLLDTDGTLLDANETALAYVDSPVEELVGTAFPETPWWAHSAELQADMRDWIRRAAEGEYVEYDATHPGPDGGRRDVSGTVRPVTDDSGSITSLVVSGRDVTERRRSERELRDRQRKLDLVLSNTDTAIAELDPAAGTIHWGEGEDDIGSPETFEGFLEAVHPDDRGRVQSDLGEMMQTGTPASAEYRVENAAGEYRWVSARSVPVEDGPDSTDVVTIATDITDLKEREEALAVSERRYRSLAENIPNGGVLTFDANLEYRLAAGELLSELGLEPSDVSGMAAGTVFPDADAGDDLVPRFRAALDGERTDRRIELDDRTIRVHVVPIDHSDEESTDARGLVLAQDVTEEARRERELFEERERFRLLTRSVEEYAFVTLDAEGDVATWNEGSENLFGYDHEGAVGTSIGRFYPAAKRESGLPGRLLEQARIAGESAHEGWHVRADGSEFHADVRYAKLRSDDGEVPGYAMIVRDMTDRRRQQRRTERFVEESDDVVSILDTDGTITYASGSADRVLGYDPENLLGESLFDHVHPDDREPTMETFFGTIRDGTGRAGIECRIESGDGEWLNVDARLRNELDDDAIDGMLLYLRDVTESKRRARRFESIFNQTFQFTGLLEPGGTVIEVNDAALEFGGFNREEVIGEPFYDVPWWTHSEEVYRDVRDALERAAGGEFVRYETNVQGASGMGTIDFSVKPVTDEYGEITLLIVEGRDITAQQERRRQMGMMQRVMRHNMRNDLSEVRGYARLLHEETDPEKRAEYLGVIEDVLDGWEGVAEKMRVIRKLLQTPPTQGSGREATELLENAIPEAKDDVPDVSIESDVAVDDAVVIPSELQEAVQELIVNAGQASDRNDPRVEVRASGSGEDDIEITVSDDGPGMPDVEAEVLESGDTTALSHGEGLGLWLVRTVVDRAGGDVSVETSSDGTTVVLRVPDHRSLGGTDAPAPSE